MKFKRDMESRIAKPFLKWAGGKTQLLKDIEDKFSYRNDEEFTYVEPFVGGGAVLFWVLNNFPNLKSAVINDINQDLINVYQVLKENPKSLISTLSKYEKEYHSLSKKIEDKKKYYYKKRKSFNSRRTKEITRAALFIFLNRTCFNGLYRVNSKNEFNVPMGKYKNPTVCDKHNLLAVSELLQKVDILSGDFENTKVYASKKTIFYLDPPYKPLSETSSFTAYTKGGFDDSEQVRLKSFCDILSKRKCKWILSNSDVKGKNSNNKFFDDLFSGYEINRIIASRRISADPNKRINLTELLISC